MFRFGGECNARSPTEDAGIPPSRRHHAVSVTPHSSPSHAIVSTTSLPSATAVVAIEATVFGSARKPRHSPEIRSRLVSVHSIKILRRRPKRPAYPTLRTRHARRPKPPFSNRGTRDPGEPLRNLGAREHPDLAGNQQAKRLYRVPEPSDVADDRDALPKRGRLDPEVDLLPRGARVS